MAQASLQGQEGSSTHNDLTLAGMSREASGGFGQRHTLQPGLNYSRVRRAPRLPPKKAKGHG